MILGTVTITGQRRTYDLLGNPTGTKRSVLRFDHTAEGFVRAHRLYKTHDPEVLIQLFDFETARHSFNLAGHLRDISSNGRIPKLVQIS